MTGKKSRAVRRRKQRDEGKNQKPVREKRERTSGNSIFSLSKGVASVQSGMVTIKKNIMLFGAAVKNLFQKRNGSSRLSSLVRTAEAEGKIKKVQQTDATGEEINPETIELGKVSRLLSVSIPIIRRVLRLLAILVFETAIAIGIVYTLFKIHEPLLYRALNLYDEGVTLMGAKRFASGEIPYRDFFTIYAPLKFSLLGFVFKIFGCSLFVARLFFLCLSFVGLIILFNFFRKESNFAYALLFTALFLPFVEISITPLLLVLIAWWFSVQVKNPTSKWLPFVGGFFLGLLFLLRIDFGGFAGIVVFLLLCFWWVKTVGLSKKRFFSILGKIAFAVALTVFPVFFSLYLAGALGQFWQQAVFFPVFGSYQELRHLPWPEPTVLADDVQDFTVDFLGLSFNFLWFFWPIPFVIATVYWFWRAFQPKFDLGGFLTNTLLGLFTLGSLIYANHRSDIGHVMFLNLLAMIFFLHLLTRFRFRLAGLLFLPVIIVLEIFPAHAYIQAKANIEAADKTRYSFFPLPLPQSDENDDLDKTLAFFRNIDTKEKIYVGVSDSSKIFINNVMLPFLLEQPAATKYHELHTGVVTTAPVQAEMIDELRSVDYVVLWDYFQCEPNLGCKSTNVNIVDEYIQANFSLTKIFGKYQILVRNMDKVDSDQPPSSNKTKSNRR